MTLDSNFVPQFTSADYHAANAQALTSSASSSDRFRQEAYQPTNSNNSEISKICSGVGNVVGDVLTGAWNEATTHPGTLALHVAEGIGFGLCAAAVAPVAGLIGAAAVGMGAYELGVHGKEWLHDLSIDFDRDGHSAQEVADARAGVQGLGGGALEFGAMAAGGVAGGLVRGMFAAAADSAAAGTAAAATADAAAADTAAASSGTAAADSGAAGRGIMNKVNGVGNVVHARSKTALSVVGQIGQNQPQRQMTLIDSGAITDMPIIHPFVLPAH